METIEDSHLEGHAHKQFHRQKVLVKSGKIFKNILSNIEK